MGTRGVYGFRIDGVEKLTYNHFDSYPDWLGRQILDWARATPIAQQREIAQALIVVPEDGRPSPEQVQACEPWAARRADGVVESGTWYSLLREAQGHPEAWTAGLRYMTDARALFHAPDSDAEWGYVLDLDLGILEVYARRPYCWEDPHADRYGLYRLAWWPLSDLPPTDDAVAHCEALEDAGWRAANPQYPWDRD